MYFFLYFFAVIFFSRGFNSAQVPICHYHYGRAGICDTRDGQTSGHRVSPDRNTPRPYDGSLSLSVTFSPRPPFGSLFSPPSFRHHAAARSGTRRRSGWPRFSFSAVTVRRCCAINVRKPTFRQRQPRANLFINTTAVRAARPLVAD